MITTIYRRDGSVLFQLETTTTTGETEVRLNLRNANLRDAALAKAHNWPEKLEEENPE